MGADEVDQVGEGVAGVGAESFDERATVGVLDTAQGPGEGAGCGEGGQRLVDGPVWPLEPAKTTALRLNLLP